MFLFGYDAIPWTLKNTYFSIFEKLAVLKTNEVLLKIK